MFYYTGIRLNALAVPALQRYRLDSQMNLVRGETGRPMGVFSSHYGRTRSTYPGSWGGRENRFFTRRSAVQRQQQILVTSMARK